MYPLKFEPILKQTLWGGDKIIPFKHLNETLPNGVQLTSSIMMTVSVRPDDSHRRKRPITLSFCT